MKVYLASRFSTRDEMREHREDIHTNLNDVVVNSRWLNEKVSTTTTIHELQPSQYLGPAIDDVEDIRACDVLVLFTVDGEIPTKRGGRHWESGFAYGLGKKIIVCGPRENIFHFLPDVTVCETFEQVKQELLKLRYESIERTRKYYEGIVGPTATGNRGGSYSGNNATY